MKRGMRDELIAKLDELAAELEAAPSSTNKRAEELYDERKAGGAVVSTASIFAMQAGMLESKCATAAIHLRVLVDVYLKGLR